MGNNDLFGLDVVLDNGGNVILTEGLVLQDEKIWKGFLEKDTLVQYVNRLMTHSWGQKVIRFYDLDGNLIEVGTPVEAYGGYI